MFRKIEGKQDTKIIDKHMSSLYILINVLKIHQYFISTYSRWST